MNNHVRIDTFENVLTKINISTEKKPTLLLGNGFSIAFNKDIFTYQSLYEQAKERGLFEKISFAIPHLFESINTFDFEQIMQILKHFLIAGDAYAVERSLLEIIRCDEELLKHILIEIITKNHPDDPSSISSEQYLSCYNFLSNFKTIYSLNYDLLLYWVVMHFLEKLKLQDGFFDGNSNEEFYQPDDYVVWPTMQSSSADIYFLHGALHLFDAGYEIRKFCWSRTGVKIKQQILDAFERKMFPLFVAEGDANSKLNKILHNGYLLKGLRSLTQANGVVITYGVSFKKNDQHIIDAIVNGNISQLYVSVFGDQHSRANIEMISNLSVMSARREYLITTRKKKKPLEVYYYDASSAKVWG